MAHDTYREEKVEEFNTSMDQAVCEHFTMPLLQMRMTLIEEETKELREEVDTAFAHIVNGGKVPVAVAAQILKELTDIQYVVSGFAVAFGLPLDWAFDAVHKSNMSKLGEDGKPVYREDGKVLKGPNYRPPNLTPFVCRRDDVE